MGDKLAVIQSQETINELKAINEQLKSTINLFKLLLSQTDAFNSKFSKGTPKEFLEGMKLLDEYSKKLIATEKQLIDLQSKYEQLNKKVEQSELASARARKANADAATAEAKTVKALNDAERSEIATKQKKDAASRASAKATDEESSAYKRLVRDASAAKAKLKDLEAEILILNRDFKTGAISQDEYNARLRVLQTEFQGASAKSKALNSDLSSINNKFKNSTGMQSMASGMVSSFDKAIKSMAAMYLGFHVIMRGGTELIKTNYDLSDSLYDLQVRLHGNKQATDDLFESLKKINTRTSLGELVNTASIVAKKGVAASEIEGITKALDDYFIVAGKEAGDREEGTASIIKLISIFNDDKQVTAGRVTEIATALVKLQNSGVATGSKMIDVAERIGAIRGLTGVTLPSVLGFAAAIEQLGQKSEVAGTAGMQILTKILTDVPKYAKMAGVSVRELREEYSKDAFAGVVMVAKGVLKTGNSEQIVKDLEEVGIRGARVKGVLSDIATNAEFVQKRIKEAGLAINEEGYLAEVAAGKQQTFAASVDKMKKQLELTASSDKFANFLQNITKLLTLFIKVIVAIPFGVVLTGLTLWTASWAYMKGNIVSATIAQSWNNKETLIGTVRNAAARLGLLGSAAASAVKTAALEAETVATLEATEATIALNTATKMSPLGIILGILAALIPLMSLYSDKTEKATRKIRTLKENQDDLNEALEKGAHNAGEEVSNLDQLYKKATDLNVAEKDRLKYVVELKAEFPSYFGQIKDEIILNGKAANSYYELRDAIVSSYRSKAIDQKLQGRASERLEDEEKILKKINEEKRINNQLSATVNETKTIREDGGDGKFFTRTVKNSDLKKASDERLKIYNNELKQKRNGWKEEDKILEDAKAAEDKKSAKLRQNQLEKLKLQEIEDEKKRKKEGAGSKLDGEQSDYIKDLEAKRDLELAVNEKYYTIGEIGEEEYVKKILSINRNFLNAKINYLKGNNAEERKLKAQAQLELAKLEKDTADKIMEIRINSVDAWRDNELADAKERRIKGETNEKQYWESYKDIQVKYRDKIQNLINLSDSKMLKLDAKTKMKLYYNLQKANEEIFDYESNILEQNFRKREDIIKDQEKKIKENDYLTESQRLNALIDNNKIMLDEVEKFYQNKIDLAKILNQDYLKIEADRDKALSVLVFERDKLLDSTLDAKFKDLEQTAKLIDLEKSITSEKYKQKVLSDKTLSNEEKEYLLSRKEKLDLIEKNKSRIEVLNKEIELLNAKAKSNTIKTGSVNNAGQSTDINIPGLILGNNDGTSILEKKNEAKALSTELKQLQIDINNLDLSRFKEEWAGFFDVLTNGLNEIQLSNFSDMFTSEFDKIFAMFQEGGDKAKIWMEATKLAASAVADALTMVSDTQKEKTIANLDEQLKLSQENTELELAFITSRLDALNNIQDKTAEQIQARNSLEDEARVLKEQQFQREKLIAIKKAKAEQKASAEQAFIGGLVGGAKALPNYAAAIASVALGALFAGIIMAKNPVPQYYVGTDHAQEGWALTQERGSEIIADKSGNIKSFGNNRGSQMTYLNEGDKVLNAFDTQAFKKKVSDTSIPDNLFLNAARGSILPPIIIPKQEIDYDLLADKITKGYDRTMKKYDKVHVFEKNGIIYEQNGGSIPVEIGEVPRQKKERPNRDYRKFRD